MKKACNLCKHYKKSWYQIIGKCYRHGIYVDYYSECNSWKSKKEETCKNCIYNVIMSPSKWCWRNNYTVKPNHSCMRFIKQKEK